MVSYDANCNGLPDDEWYELAGSEYYKPATLHNFSITYRRPDPSQTPVENEDGYLSDIYYIPWTDSEGNTGYIAKNTFHGQSYYPLWVEDDELTFSGSRLMPNGIDISGTGRYYVLYAYDWGYVDNHPNEFEELNSFDIGNAVDKDGKKCICPEPTSYVYIQVLTNTAAGWAKPLPKSAVPATCI